MTAVRASGIVKRFGPTCALDQVDLVVQEGEVRGLLGANGAGKTTLLRILFGLVAPDAGAVEVLGRELNVGAPHALAGVAGFVEAPAFYPYLSGRANLELLAELDGNRDVARVDETLDQVGLTRRGEERVSGYSTGMRQRLGIAAAMLRSPRLLLLDEPTAGLDPEGVRDVGALVQELREQGVAILMSSHQIGEIEDVCDGFTVLRSGRVVWAGSSADLRAQAPASTYRLETSDDDHALALAERTSGVRAARTSYGYLAVGVEPGALDGYVLALGANAIAVRRLELVLSPLRSMFFALTDEHPRERIDLDDPAELLERVGSAP